MCNAGGGSDSLLDPLRCDVFAVSVHSPAHLHHCPAYILGQTGSVYQPRNLLSIQV